MQGTPDLDDPVAIAPQSEPWGKFVSLNGNKVKSQDLHEIETSIGRNPTNTISIPDNRLSGIHCKIKWDNINCVASLVDLSTNGTFIGDSKLGKNNEVLLKNGDEIYFLHKSKVSISDVIGFTLIIQKVKKEEKVEVVVDQAQQKKIQQIEDMQEDIHCPICDDLIYQAVCLMPCLHNFCGACFSDWMAKQKTCPSCRKDVQRVSKNPLVNNVVEKYLNLHPEKKRPPEEYKEMDEKNKIKGDLVFNEAFPPPPPPPTLIINTQPARGGRGRGRGGVAVQQQQQQQQQPPQPQVNNNRANKQSNISDYSADDDDGPVNRDCVTCRKEINGYQCARKGMHLNCTNCQSKMPKFDPGEKRLVFRCELCEKYFCTLYNKNCQQLSKKNPNCRIEKHQIPGAVDIQSFRNNYIEQKEFLDFMKNKNITTQDIFRYMLDNYISKGGFRYVVNKRTSQQFEKEINLLIQPETPVCSMCFGLIWQQIVFRYRIAIRDQLSSEVKNRGYCWFGVNCKTMTHNQEHAKKLDHMCEQTKF